MRRKVYWIKINNYKDTLFIQFDRGWFTKTYMVRSYAGQQRIQWLLDTYPFEVSVNWNGLVATIVIKES